MVWFQQKRLKLIGIDAKMRAQLLTLQYSGLPPRIRRLTRRLKRCIGSPITGLYGRISWFWMRISLLKINGSPVYCVQPPLNGIDWPTKKLLSCEAKNSANSASSLSGGQSAQGYLPCQRFLERLFFAQFARVVDRVFHVVLRDQVGLYVVLGDFDAQRPNIAALSCSRCARRRSRLAYLSRQSRCQKPRFFQLVG